MDLLKSSKCTTLSFLCVTLQQWQRNALNGNKILLSKTSAASTHYIMLLIFALTEDRKQSGSGVVEAALPVEVWLTCIYKQQSSTIWQLIILHDHKMLYWWWRKIYLLPSNQPLLLLDAWRNLHLFSLSSHEFILLAALRYCCRCTNILGRGCYHPDRNLQCIYNKELTPVTTNKIPPHTNKLSQN